MIGANSMVLENETLKPCPFCGSEAVMEKSIRYVVAPDDQWIGYSTLCSDESCIAHQRQKFYLLEESARKAWNKRATDK